MNKIHFLPLAMTLLAVNMAFAADEIHWTITGKDSVTFDWRGTAAEKTIGYGLTSGVYTQVTATTPNPVPVSSSGPFWEAKLTGLTENTRYYYSIGNGPERSFRTPPAPGSSDFTVYAEGNIGSSTNYFNMGVVQDIIANDLPSFVVGLGNLTLGSTNGKAAVDQHFNDVMVWSKEAAYMPVWGNQEWKTTSSDSFKNYKGRFAIPNPQTSPGSPLAGGKDWYWFDYGNVRFITMPDSWTGAWADWKTKADALMTQAQTDPNIKFIVTMVHQPAYSSGHYAGSSTLKGILDALGDTHSKYKLNINAHSNNYERTFPQHGVIHVTAGTGGANLTQDGTCLWLTCAQPSWSAFRAMHLGALKLHFMASGIEGSFICGPAGGGTNDVTCTKGSVVDRFTISSSTVTAAATASKSGASSVTSAVPMASAAPVASAATTSNLLGNPGFESGSTIWAVSTNLIVRNSSSAAHSGSWEALLDGYGSIHTDTLSQTVSIPGSVTSATLSFWLHIDTAETTTSTVWDKLSVQVQNSSGTVLKTLATYSNLDKNTGYVQKSFDLSPYKGQTVQIVLTGTEDRNQQTSFFLDDFLLETNTSTSTSDTQAPTVPTSLTATGSSSSQINLSWSASTDNVGVTGYKIYRNGSQVGTATTASYSDSGLTASTSYSYTVTAYDAAGNISGNSTAATATTSGATTTTLSCATPPTSSLVVSVKDKGATGNGSSNDTAAIQAAVNQVAGTGGTVLVPDGTYMVDATVSINLKSKMTFRMSSGAVLKAIPNNMDSYRILSLYHISDVNVIGGTLMGERNAHTGTTGQGGDGLSLYNVTNLVVEGVTAQDGRGDGFYVGQDSSGVNSNLKFCSVIADNNRRSGMSITHGDGIVVKDSIFKNTNGGDTLPMDGINLEPNSGQTINNVQIKNSQFLGNSGSGVKLVVRNSLIGSSFVKNVIVDGNTISNNGITSTYSAGIRLIEVQSNQVSNNIVNNNIEGGMDLMGSTVSNNTITANTVTGNGIGVTSYGGVGIWIHQQAANNTITNNTVTGNQKRNIWNSDGGVNTISGNTAP